LTVFCQALCEKHARQWPPSEDALALEFVEFFNLEPFIFFAKLQDLCKDLGIALTVAALPDCLRGVNYRFKDKREILVSSTQSIAGLQEHTALHELREHVEYEFKKMKMPVCKPDDREKRAEDFAVAVRVAAFGSKIPAILDKVSTIESKWPRRASYVGIGLLSVAYVLAVTLTPRLEEMLEIQKTRFPYRP